VLALHGGQKPRGEVHVRCVLRDQTELGPHALEPMACIAGWKGLDHLRRARQGAGTIRIEEGEQRLGQPR
jgi:hypothetical protein